MPRLLATTLLLGAVTTGLLLVPIPDADAAPGLTLTPATAVAGGTVTISGTGCWEAGLTDVPDRPWTVQVSVPPSTVATVPMTTGPAGAWSVTVQLPTSHPGGTLVTATCALSSAKFFAYEKAYLRILPPTLPPTPPPAPVPAAPPPLPAPKPTVTRAPSPSATPTPAPPSPMVTSEPAAAPATAAAAPGCGDCARVVPEEPLEAGERLRLSYTGFQPGEQVTVIMRSTPVTLGTFTADAAGTVRAAVELPDDAGSGAHTLTFSGAVSGDLVVLPFRVEAAEEAVTTTAARDDEFASDDGSPASWLIGGGVAALALAGAGVVLYRRRRHGEAQVTETPIAEPIR